MFLPKDTPLLSRAAATAILVATLLVLVPCAVLSVVVGPQSAPPRLRLLQLPLTCWAACALVSPWAALDFFRRWRVLRRPVDPPGTQALWGALLGVFNIDAALLLVMSRASD
jgi:hypothetical protein